MIFLQPHSGLANRIRVICSGFYLADQVDQQLIIYWRRDDGLNCRFYDLFERNAKFEVVECSFRLRLLDSMRTMGIFRKITYKISRVDFAMFDHDFKKYVWSTNSDFLDMTLVPKTARNYYIKACNEFMFDPGYLQFLKPVAKVQDLINLELAQFPQKIIGVHIRRTDNRKSVEESPTNLFIEKIKAELAADPEMIFFLATDDAAVEEYLMQIFKFKILRSAKYFTRDSQAGIVGAMVDLYCLAATSKIYGSYWSSFSSVAACIGNIPLEVLKK